MGTWLTQLEKHMTLNLRVRSLRSTWGVERFLRGKKTLNLKKHHWKQITAAFCYVFFFSLKDTLLMKKNIAIFML